METPRVSIVIPTYNRAAYLPRTLASAAAQRCADIEIIVCDNASTDATGALVKTFRHDHPALAVRYIRHATNIGPVRNWFSGIAAARGAFTKILFSDDYLYPGCVHDLLAPYDNARPAFTYGKVDNLWQGSRVTNYARFRRNTVVTPSDYVRAYFSPLLTWENYPVSPGAALFETSILRQIPLDQYTDCVGNDVVASGIGPDMLMFLYSYLLSGRDGLFVDRKVAAFEGHAGSITVTSGRDHLDRHNFSAVLRFYQLLPDGTELKKVLEEYFDRLAAAPSFFRQTERRLDLLRTSGWYAPRARPTPFPYLGWAGYQARRIRAGAEFRLVRLLGGHRNDMAVS